MLNPARRAWPGRGLGLGRGAGPVLAVAGTALALALASAATPAPAPDAARPGPAMTNAAAGRPSAPPSAAPSSQPSSVPTEVPPTVAIVPVTSFRNPWASTAAAEVASVVAGTSDRYARLELTRDDAAAILGALGAAPPRDDAPVVLAPDAAALLADLAEHQDRLGFLRADQVTPAVRALRWGELAAFGTERVRSFDRWPLAIPAGAPGATAHPAYDPGRAWTLVAGGDVNLDGAVAYAIKNRGYGVDYPWAGGTAEITSRYCCSSYGHEMARARKTGNGGAVRALLVGADLAIANFENPAPDRYRYHPAGFVFSADPALIEGLANAGIDWVSLANNHIRDAGSTGVLETLDNLDAWGVAHGGAGRDASEARRPSILAAGDVEVAILAYDTIRPAYAATATRPGSAQMTAERVKADVTAARAAGAEVVIVFPHWGTEYSARTTATQRALARAAIDAGADVVLGNHTHWVGGLEVYKGRPIFYSLADFVFAIGRAEQTMEGILVELTFMDTRLVQVAIHPFFIVDKTQPNLLDPAGSGEVVLAQLFAASPRLPW